MSDNTVVFLLVPGLFLSILIFVGVGRRMDIRRVIEETDHVYGFALVTTETLYVIFDLDHPRVGLIRLDYADQAMQDLIVHMQSAPAAQAP